MEIEKQYSRIRALLSSVEKRLEQIEIDIAAVKIKLNQLYGCEKDKGETT